MNNALLIDTDIVLFKLKPGVDVESDQLKEMVAAVKTLVGKLPGM